MVRKVFELHLTGTYLLENQPVKCALIIHISSVYEISHIITNLLPPVCGCNRVIKLFTLSTLSVSLNDLLSLSLQLNNKVTLLPYGYCSSQPVKINKAGGCKK